MPADRDEPCCDRCMYYHSGRLRGRLAMRCHACAQQAGALRDAQAGAQ